MHCSYEEFLKLYHLHRHKLPWFDLFNICIMQVNKYPGHNRLQCSVDCWC